MSWVYKAPGEKASSGYALREQAVEAAVRRAALSRTGHREPPADQIETLWRSLKQAGWAVYQVGA